MTNIYSTLNQIIARKMQINEIMIFPEADFSLDFRADQNDVLNLILECEKTFKIKLPHDQVNMIHTVEDAYLFIQASLYGQKIMLDFDHPFFSEQ